MFEGQTIRAVLFDLDGTLYHQGPMRAFMALESLTMPLAGLSRASRRWRALLEYRRALERFRHEPRTDRLIAEAMISEAASATGLSAEEVKRLVTEWMLSRPLKYIRLCRVRGLLPLLDWLEGKGIQTGVLSDYPVVAKLEALGVGGRFRPVLCSLDPAINALKPDPYGFRAACESWGLPPGDVLMVGDRAEVDAAGAIAAGMKCVVIGRQDSPGAERSGYVVIRSLERLHRVLSV
jgi:HAD superfamily hydrolase (TIGR01549 family)